jgi:hypothetical protein
MKKLISVSDCLLEVIKQSNYFISFQDFISFIPLKNVGLKQIGSFTKLIGFSSKQQTPFVLVYVTTFFR